MCFSARRAGRTRWTKCVFLLFGSLFSNVSCLSVKFTTQKLGSVQFHTQPKEMPLKKKKQKKKIREKNEKLLSLSYFCERHKSLVYSSLPPSVCLLFSWLFFVFFWNLHTYLTYVLYLPLLFTHFHRNCCCFCRTWSWKLCSGAMTAAATCNTQHSRLNLRHFCWFKASFRHFICAILSPRTIGSSAAT